MGNGHGKHLIVKELTFPPLAIHFTARTGTRSTSSCGVSGVFESTRPEHTDFVSPVQCSIASSSRSRFEYHSVDS